MATIEELYRQGRENWASYLKTKRAAAKPAPSIETYYGDENVFRQLPVRRADDEMAQRAFHPKMFQPGYEGLEKARIETEPGNLGARVAQFIAERQHGEGGTEPRKISLEEQLAKWLHYPGDVYNPPGYYPAKETAERAAEKRRLDITEAALNQVQPQFGTGDFWLPDPNNPKEKKLVKDVPYVLERRAEGTYKTILPKLDEGTATQEKTNPMPAPGVQSFTPAEAEPTIGQRVSSVIENMTLPGPSRRFNYLRQQKEQGQAGAELAARFGNAATAEDKQRILGEMSDAERGLLRQHLLTKQTTASPPSPVTGTAEEQRRRRQLLLYYGMGQK
jgi:hypothetical protein